MPDLRAILRPRLARSVRGWMTVVVMLACSVVAAYQSYEAKSLLAQATAKREHIEAKNTRLARAVTRLTPEQARHWQALGADIQFPWNEFFQAVEKTSNVDIELLEMTPDKLRRVLILRGEARNSAALIGYTQSLATQPGLHDVFLSHMQNVERGSLLTVEFEIRMSVI